MSTTPELDLWPVPSLPPSNSSPSRLPGSTPDSTRALTEVLRVNHEKWHVFYDDLGRHNHISHHVLAVWAMGAHPDTIRMGYEKNEQMMRPRGTSSELITQRNFNDHLGEHSYYDAYVRFFIEEIGAKGLGPTVEESIFSTKANFGGVSKTGAHPSMLSRFLAALLHAMIHVGYGAEFGLPGMFAEGLAMAACCSSGSSQILPPALFQEVDTLRKNERASGNPQVDVFSTNVAPTLSSLSNRAATRLSAVVSALSKPPPTKVKNVHAFDVIARIINDPKVVHKELGLGTYNSVLETCGDAIYRYVSAWSLDTSSVEAKIEELQWAVTLLYAVSGFRQLDGGEFNADFLAMHFVTSAIFLPSLVPYLSVPSQILLLRAHFAVCVTWWVAIGKPNLDIPAFFAADTANPTPSGPHPPINQRAIPSPDSPVAINPNPWTYIIQQALIHPDDHVPKILRALLHYATVYGGTAPGSFGGTELKGAEKIDGTLFIRAAGLTVERVGREFKEVPPLQVYWDRKTYVPGAPHGSY